MKAFQRGLLVAAIAAAVSVVVRVRSKGPVPPTSGGRRPTLQARRALDADARQRAVRVIAGCGLAPGLADVLARHAVGALDAVDELHVARWGVAGAESASEARRAQREPSHEWRNGELVHEK